VADVILAGDSAVYTCTHTVGALDANPYVNTARAIGTDDLKLTEAKDSHADASIVIPGIVVDKQVRNVTQNRTFADSGRGAVGETMEFRHVVTNTGNVPLVTTVTDDKCTGLTGPAGFDGVDDVIGAGQTVEYTCQHVLLATDANPFVNVVLVKGVDPLGTTVTSTDRAQVDIPAIEPGEARGGPVPTASSRLVPPSGCQRAIFRPMVMGSNIRQVRFYVDGKLRATVRSATRGRWIARLNATGLRAGTHRLVAIVTFTSATGTRPRTIRSTFGVCRPPAALPAFTG
jgi:hypothetical protein